MTGGRKELQFQSFAAQPESEHEQSGRRRQGARLGIKIDECQMSASGRKKKDEERVENDMGKNRNG